MVRSRTVLALCDPEPFTVATWMLKSLTTGPRTAPWSAPCTANSVVAINTPYQRWMTAVGKHSIIRQCASGAKWDSAAVVAVPRGGLPRNLCQRLTFACTFTCTIFEGTAMTITYDQQVDALYIRFRETTVTTKHLADGIAADYDSEGHLAGIEILDAMKQLGDPAVFRRVTLEDVALAH